MRVLFKLNSNIPLLSSGAPNVNFWKYLYHCSLSPVQNLGVWLASNLSMGDHITKTSCASCHYWYNIRRITKNVQKHWYMPLFLGPVHTHPFSFENATLSLRIRLPSTRIRWQQSMQTELFEYALQSGTFWKRCFRAYVWTDENGTFRKRWGHTISSNPLCAILETLIQDGGRALPFLVFYTCAYF